MKIIDVICSPWIQMWRKRRNQKLCNIYSLTLSALRMTNWSVKMAIYQMKTVNVRDVKMHGVGHFNTNQTYVSLKKYAVNAYLARLLPIQAVLAVGKTNAFLEGIKPHNCFQNGYFLKKTRGQLVMTLIIYCSTSMITPFYPR